MKKFLSLLLSLISCLSMFAQSPTEYFNVGNPIKFCGTKYYLAWSANPQENYFIQEYLPKGETFEHFNQMFTVGIIFGFLTPSEAVQIKIDELERRKKTDPLIHYQVMENNDNEERMLEFIVSEGENGEVSIVEVNVYHYKQMTINGRNAIVVGFYSGRAYDDDILKFIQSIPDKRNSWYQGLINLKLNPVFLKK